jgi:hypothetical protein
MAEQVLRPGMTSMKSSSSTLVRPLASGTISSIGTGSSGRCWVPYGVP